MTSVNEIDDDDDDDEHNLMIDVDRAIHPDDHINHD